MNRLAERRTDSTGRSTGRRKKKSKIDGQFIARLREMNESPAFGELTLSGHRVLARVEIEHCLHGGVENGRLPVTYDDFVDFGITRECIAPAIALVEALGLLEVTERGRAGNAEFRKPNLFRLTYLPTPEADPTHEWRRIKTKEQAKCIAQSTKRKQNSSRGSSDGSVLKFPTERVQTIVGNPALQ